MKSVGKIFTVCFVNLMLCMFSLQADGFAEEVHRPGWWLEQGMAFVGNWEPLSFRIRLGAVPRDYRTGYEFEHRESTVIRLKEAGVNMVLTHFYKGLGPELEEEDLKYTRKLVGNLKKHGMYAGAYIGSTLFSETMYREIPEAAALIQRDYHGAPVPYWNQYFRDRADFTKKGYRDLIKSQVTKAIKKYGMNLIHFDNFSYMFPLDAGYTDHLHQLFRKYLEEKYTPEERKIRLGFSDVSLVVPPRVSEQPMRPVRDPLVQEWTCFRVEALTGYVKELYEHIRNLDPEVVVEFNPHGIWGNNLAYRTGMDHSYILPYMDAFWSEDPDHAHYYPEENRLISKIRSYKLGQHFDNALFAYNRKPLELAESMAFNRMCLGDLGWSIIDPASESSTDTETCRRYIDFFNNHLDLFRALEPIDDVGVMRDFASMTFGGWGPFLTTVQAEQVLIQNRVPFTLLFEQDWDNLSAYSVIVLAAQENLTNEEIKTVREYVMQGGGLVVVGKTTGQYDDWRRARRGEDSFWGIMGLDEIETEPGRPARLSFGKGLIYYLPGFVNHPDIPEIDFRVNPEYWKLPLNWEEFMAGLYWARGGEFSIAAETKPWVAAAHYRKGNQRQVHLVNYWPGHSVRYVPVIFTETGFDPGNAVLYSPEHPALKLDLNRYRDGFSVIIPELGTYCLLVVE